jgi:hypothetical protein
MVLELFGCEGGVAGYEYEYHVWHAGDVVRVRERHEAGTTRLGRELAAQSRLETCLWYGYHKHRYHVKDIGNRKVGYIDREMGFT